MFKNLVFLTFIFLICLISFPSLSQTSIDSSFTHNSVSKEYSIYEPCTFRDTIPTKFMMAFTGLGVNETPSNWRDTLSNFADENNLLLVVPHATSGMTDTAFATALLDSMLKWYSVDTNAIYLMGFSWGGKLTYYFGIDNHNIFTGLLPFAAGMTSFDLTNGFDSTDKKNASDMPIAIVHGGNDFPNVRVTPVIDTFKNYTSFIWDTIIPGVVHTYTFKNRDDYLKLAIDYLDSINNVIDPVLVGTVEIEFNDTLYQCSADSIEIAQNLSISSSLCLDEFTYKWKPKLFLNDSSSKNPKAHLDSSFYYSVTVTDLHGNSDSDTVYISIIPSPNISFNKVTDTICPDSSTQIKVLGTHYYYWGEQIGVSCDSCSNPTISSSNEKKFWVIGIDSNKCTVTDTFLMKTFSLPNISISNDTSICVGDTAHISAWGVNNYVWGNSDKLSGKNQSSVVAFPQISTYFSVTATDLNNCSIDTGVSIFVKPYPTINLPDDTTLCYGTKLILQPSGAVNYEWLGSNISCNFCPNPIFNGKSTSILTVIGSDQFGCSDSMKITVYVRDPLPLLAFGDTTICEGDTALLKAEGAISYFWPQGTNLDCNSCKEVKAFPSTSTIFQIIGIDHNVCTDTTDVSVMVNPLPIVSLMYDTIHCFGDSSIISVTNTDPLIWNANPTMANATSNSPIVFPDSNSWYFYHSTSNEGCTLIDSIYFQVQKPIAHFSKKSKGLKWYIDISESANYDSLEFSGAEGGWYEDSMMFWFDHSGIYTFCLRVYTNEGCFDEYCLTEKVIATSILEQNEKQMISIAPNPNEGTFKILRSDLQYYNIRIFSSTGALVYSKPNISKTISVSNLSKGYYYIVLESKSGTIHTSFIIQ